MSIQFHGEETSMDTENTPNKCSFCGSEIIPEAFKAYGLKDSPATICCYCIKTFATCVKFREIIPIFFMEKVDFSPIKESLNHRFAGEAGSSKLKSIVANLATQLMLRACSRLSGLESKLVMKNDCMQELCPKTGIVLSPPRIAIISRESEICIRLLELACSELGLFFRHVDGRNLIDGTAYTELRDFQAGGVSGGEERWAENGIIVCKEFVRPNARCGVIFCLDAKTKMPSNLKIETMIA